MKKVLLLITIFASFSLIAQKDYTPTAQNLEARKQFQADRFGMFIHWGLSSVLGDGEWVMNNRKILKKDYQRYLSVFNPIDFNPEEWVLSAKNAGMKYIVFITRHHDSFSNWDTQYSDWKITNTPYGKDALKMLADACKKHDIKLGLYYSTLDWYREDYPHQTGRTGQNTGRKGKGDYASYLQFMKNQLTELLTNYGPIMSIWLDGHWDQTNVEGSENRDSRIDWKYEELYGLIHQLQPATLIGNNHHLAPIPGEDFQMFERDLPGENKSGYSFQKPSDNVPVETCETMSESWGYDVNDRKYKSVKTLVSMLVGAGGRDANLLLNVGPMPNGEFQPENIDTLKAVGEWIKKYGNTIYGTHGKIIPPQDWGVITANDKEAFVHILKKPENDYIFLPNFNIPIKDAESFDRSEKFNFTQMPEGTFIYPNYSSAIDYIIRLGLP